MEKRNAAVEDFYAEYFRLKQQYNLNMSSKMNASGECVLEIYMAEGEQKHYISKLNEEDDDGTLIYTKALNDLRTFEKKQKQSVMTA